MEDKIKIIQPFAKCERFFYSLTFGRPGGLQAVKVYKKIFFYAKIFLRVKIYAYAKLAVTLCG